MPWPSSTLWIHPDTFQERMTMKGDITSNQGLGFPENLSLQQEENCRSPKTLQKWLSGSLSKNCLCYALSTRKTLLWKWENLSTTLWRINISQLFGILAKVTHIESTEHPLPRSLGLSRYFIALEAAYFYSFFWLSGSLLLSWPLHPSTSLPQAGPFLPLPAMTPPKVLLLSNV